MKTIHTRRSALTLIAAAALAPSAVAQEASGELAGAERAQAIADASAALNGIRTLQGRFVQMSPGGQVSTGQFYMQRPGRLRFAYDPPAAMLIVADGTVVAVQDTALRSVNRAPLRSTPLYFVLKDNINLARDARVTSVRRIGGSLFVTARDRTGNADGQITFALIGPQMELRAWDVIDATGARTRLNLSQLTRPASINPTLFRAPVPPATLRGTRQ